MTPSLPQRGRQPKGCIPLIPFGNLVNRMREADAGRDGENPLSSLFRFKEPYGEELLIKTRIYEKKELML